MIISPQKYNDRNFICIIARCMMIKTRDSQLDKIDWLVYNTNFSNISALSWCGEAIVAMIYGSWIYNYLCNRCLSPLMWVWISIRARCTTLCDKSLSVTCDRSVVFSRYSNKKTDRHDITEILLKVRLNTIKQTNYRGVTIELTNFIH
jgi:hypothetical protein